MINRLTKLAESKYVYGNGKYEANIDWSDPMSIRLGSNKIYEITDKLGELEDIEDELGIDLITLLKALKNGIWLIDEVGTISFTDDCETNGREIFVPDFGYMPFNEYGKGWALTKEELEK